MEDPTFIERLHRHLVKRGCPPGYLERARREVAEHLEDLQREAMAAGASAAASRTEAETRLGSPEVLAERLIAALRAASWWGRHPAIGFGLLPILVMPLMMGLVFLVAMAVVAGCAPTRPIPAALLAAVAGVRYGGITLVAAGFCTLARRQVCGRKWSLTACLVCAVPAAFLGIGAAPDYAWCGFSTDVDWAGLAIPLGVGLLASVGGQRLALAGVAPSSVFAPGGSQVPSWSDRKRPVLWLATAVLATALLVSWAHFQVAAKPHLPSLVITPLTRQELASQVPHSYYFDYDADPQPGKRVWKRVNDSRWIELYPDGFRSTFAVLGHARIHDTEGTVLAKIAGDPQVTETPNDRTLQVFIPDKGSPRMHHWYRNLARGDVEWNDLGPMQDVK